MMSTSEDNVEHNDVSLEEVKDGIRLRTSQAHKRCFSIVARVLNGYGKATAR